MNEGNDRANYLAVDERGDCDSHPHAQETRQAHEVVLEEELEDDGRDEGDGVRHLSVAAILLRNVAQFAGTEQLHHPSQDYGDGGP